MSRWRPEALGVANLVFVLAMTLHGIDHLTQARGAGALSREVVWGGVVLAVIALATLPLTLGRHPRAPLAAAVVGLWTAFAVAAAHLAPHWSAFSDPYPDLGLGVWSWTVVLAEIVAGLVFGLIGVARLRRPERSTRAVRTA
jgi:hypothetical protein